MDIKDAIDLIKTGLSDKTGNSTWADLGCGTGTFTKALVALLGDGSKVFAVDKETQQFNVSDEKKEIAFLKLDFLQEKLPIFNLDGMLMANALHYVKDKAHFITALKDHLKPGGQIIIVEYDTEISNQWVPYPISYRKLVEVFSSLGLSNVKKIGERDSIYRSGKMYACVIKCL
jgi:ubiquinone/menaquinone biosynthesis C-methylase UbiE